MEILYALTESKPKIVVDQLVIEVTRQCNINCLHCLRGNAQNVVFDLELLPYIFNNISHISNITFTGGEPTLYPNIIKEIFLYMKENNITLGSFYIVTNGIIKPTYDFLNTLINLYAYSDEKEYCGLDVSVDQFHEEYNIEAYELYQAFSFMQHNKEIPERKGSQLINMGRAYEHDIGVKDINYKTSIDDLSFVDYEDFIQVDETVYISGNGNVTLHCDMSYDLIDDEEENIGTIGKKTELYLFDILGFGKKTNFKTINV